MNDNAKGKKEKEKLQQYPIVAKKVHLVKNSQYFLGFGSKSIQKRREKGLNKSKTELPQPSSSQF